MTFTLLTLIVLILLILGYLDIDFFLYNYMLMSICVNVQSNLTINIMQS